MNLTLSDKAYTHINSLLQEHDSTWARLQVKAGKCAGLVYDWTFDTSKTADDKEIDGVLLVDKSNEPYLSGIEIGYKADLMEVNSHILTQKHRQPVVVAFLFM